MFLIVPKPRQTALETNATSTKPAPLAPISSSRGPTRAVAACDRCRIRKVKCNGKEPCQRCSQSSNICVFSKPRDEVGLVSGAYVSMLKSQQRRLVVALRNMDSIIEGLPRPSSEHQHDSHAEFDLTGILEKYAPCSKSEAMKDGTSKEYPDEPNNGPSKKRRFQHNPSLGEETPTWPGTSLPDIAPAPGVPDNQWPIGDPTYNLAGEWDQRQGGLDPSSIELRHESEKISETWDQSPPDLELNTRSNELQHDYSNSDAANDFTPNVAAPQDGPPGSELTPYNMSFEELYQLIDWDASWQSCSEHFPMPDAGRNLGSGPNSMDWQH